MNVQPDQALTLAAIMAEGTFDAAAQRLHLTPSAVSQRVRALEVTDDGSTPRITLVVNSDSLHTWALSGLAGVADQVQLTILREDQDHSLDLLRRGAAHGAVTATAAPVPGCTSRALGVMRYRPVCAPAFADRWFADGVSRAT